MHTTGIRSLTPGISGSQNCKHIKVCPKDTLLLLFSCQNPLLHSQDIWSPSLCFESIHGKREPSSGVPRLLLKLSSNRTLGDFYYLELEAPVHMQEWLFWLCRHARRRSGYCCSPRLQRQRCLLGVEPGDGPGYGIVTQMFLQ